jgi:hypothetical protein
MKGWTIVIGAALVILVTGVAGAQERYVASGDSLVVEVRGHPELSGRFQVNSFGDLLIPRGGVVPVAGLVLPAVAQRISEVYRPYFGSLRVSVTSPAAVDAPQERTPRTEPTAPLPDTAEVVRQEIRRDASPVDTLAAPDSLVAAPDSLRALPVIAAPVTREPIPMAPAAPPHPATTSPDTLTDPERIRPDTAARPEAVRPAAPADPEPVAVSPPAPAQAVVEFPTTPAPAEAIRIVAAPSPSGWDFGVAALGGVTSTTSSHGYGGLLLTGGWHKLGVMGLGQYGAGGGYSSLLFTGGLTYEVYRLGPLSVLGAGGYSYYSEKGDVGIQRSLPAVMAGGIARVRIGPIRPSVALTGFFGSYEGDELTEPFSLNFMRISFGLGF